MTDPTTPKAPRAKATPVEAQAADAAAATEPEAAQVAPAKAPAAKAPVVKAPVVKAPAAKAPVVKAPVVKAPSVTAPSVKAPAAKAAPAPRTRAAASTATASVPEPVTIVPVEVLPVEPIERVAPIAPVAQAAAAAGWYPVEAGSPQQRYWDGVAWTQHTFDPTVPAVAAAPAQYAQPPQAAIPVQGVALKAPEGTSPSTLWFWLTAVSPVVAIAGVIPTAIFFNQFAKTPLAAGASGALLASPAYLISTILSLLEIVVYVLFPILDWAALRKRGVPNPFHWAWSLAAIILGTPTVYVIGRTVVAKRRTGKGLAPLWVFIVLQLAAWISLLVVIILFIVAFSSHLSDSLNGLSGLS